MKEKERQIIDDVRQMFMKYGIKSMNMDDIAKHLRISKKTLYKFVKDKNELVKKTIELHCEMEDTAIYQCCAKGLNAIDEMFEISMFIAELLRNVHPSIHYDLEKYHPEVWNEMLQTRNTVVYECMYANIERGKKEGLYRKDLNTDVIAKLYMSKIDIMFDAKLFPPDKISFDQVYLESFRYHIRGIASEKGVKHLVEKIKNEKLK